MKTICLANGKGGVGKSTMAANIALVLAHKRKKKVLMIDLDENQSLSTFFKISYDVEDPLTIIDALTKPSHFKIKDTLIQISENLFLSPSYGADLREYGTILQKKDNYELILRQLLKTIEGDFDYVIVDTPGTKESSFMYIGVCASDLILIPMAPSNMDLVPSREFIIKVYETLDKHELEDVDIKYFFNRIKNSSTSQINRANRTFPEEHKKNVLKTKMGDYNAYQNFLEEDKSIVENSEKAGNKRPAEQLFKLVNEVLS